VERRKSTAELAAAVERGEGWCPRCRAFKPVGEFATDRSRKFGYATKCRACDAAAHRARYVPSEARAARVADRSRAIEIYGGVCAMCGSTDDLEFDHVDRNGQDHRTVETPLQMVRRIARTGERLTDYRLRLLCRPDHRRTDLTVGVGGRGRRHGTRSMYSTGCRCEPCRAAIAEYYARRRAVRAATDAAA
jgi:hypothetical protein